MPKKQTNETSPDDIVRSMALFATNTDFMLKFISTLEPKSIRQPEVAWVLKKVIKYGKEKRAAPSFEILRSMLDKDKKLRDEEKELVTPFIDEMEARKPKRKEHDYYRGVFEDYIQKSYLGFLVRQVSELVNQGEPEEAENRIKESIMPREAAVSLVFAPDNWSLLFDRKFDQDKGIPTGIVKLDNRITGLRSGELGVWLAPTGYGKSMALVVCGTAAYRLGFNVVHFTFENTEEETLKRYATSMMGKSIETLTREGGLEGVTVKRFLDHHGSIGAQVAISRLIGSQTDTGDLLSNLYAIEDVYEFTPNLIIVDYGDLMKPTVAGNNKYENMQSVFAELRDLATDVGRPIWTATQSNRDGLKAKRVKLDHIGESLGKAMVADLIVAISRPEKDAAEAVGQELHDGDIAELQIVKFRRGEEGKAPVKVRTNFRLARFDDLDAEEERGKELEKDDNKAKQNYNKKRAEKRKAEDATDD